MKMHSNTAAKRASRFRWAAFALGVVGIALLSTFVVGCGSDSGSSSSSGSGTTAVTSTGAEQSEEKVPAPSEEDELLRVIRELDALIEAGEIEVKWPPAGSDTDSGARPGESPVESPTAFLAWQEEQLTERPDMTVFLENGTAEDIQRLERTLESRPEVTTFSLVTKEEALERLRESLGEHADEVIGGLERNPLPVSFEIELRETRGSASGEEIAEVLRGDPVVTRVDVAASVESMARTLLTVLEGAEARNPEAEQSLEQIKHSAERLGRGRNDREQAM